MDKKVLKFLTRANIKPSDILYFIREERQTVVHLVNGETVSTYIPMKYLLAAMPKGAFLNITKGVVIAAGEIARIDGAVYTMRSGQQFLGRRRGAGEHKTNRTRLENRADAPGRVVADSLELRFSGLDNSPLACCVIELVINGAGDGQAQVYRYIRLTELIPELLQLVDESRIAFRPAVELSYLKKEEQSALLEEISYTDATPSLAQAIKMKKFSNEGKLSHEVIESIMSEEKPNQKEKINIKYEDARKFIPASVPYDKTGDYIMKALEYYHRYQERQKDRDAR